MTLMVHLMQGDGQIRALGECAAFLGHCLKSCHGDVLTLRDAELLVESTHVPYSGLDESFSHGLTASTIRALRKLLFRPIL